VEPKEEMNKEQELLFNNIWAPAFFAKCAELGFVPDSEESANMMLENAALVKKATRAKSDNLVKSANASLKNLLGVRETPAKPATSASVKTAAVELSKVPDLRKALLA